MDEGGGKAKHERCSSRAPSCAPCTHSGSDGVVAEVAVRLARPVPVEGGAADGERVGADVSSERSHDPAGPPKRSALSSDDRHPRR